MCRFCYVFLRFTFLAQICKRVRKLDTLTKFHLNLLQNFPFPTYTEIITEIKGSPNGD